MSISLLFLLLLCQKQNFVSSDFNICIAFENINGKIKRIELKENNYILFLRRKEKYLHFLKSAL